LGEHALIVDNPDDGEKVTKGQAGTRQLTAGSGQKCGEGTCDLAALLRRRDKGPGGNRVPAKLALPTRDDPRRTRDQGNASGAGAQARSIADRPLGGRNYRLDFIRVTALRSISIHGGSDVVVGLPCDNGGIGIRRASVQSGIDLGVGPAHCAAAIDVVARKVRSAVVPGKIDAVLRRRGSGAGKGFAGRRI
jgi:hypothetical protein